jgi:hypothetical protein
MEKINGESHGWPDVLPKLPPSFARHARVCAGKPNPEDMMPIQPVSDQNEMIQRLLKENEGLKKGYSELREGVGNQTLPPEHFKVIAQQAEKISVLERKLDDVGQANLDLMDRMSKLADVMEAMLENKKPKRGSQVAEHAGAQS